jgi:hypothetical protein
VIALRITVPFDTADITEAIDTQDSTATADTAEPMASTDAKEPIDPIESADPTLPIESTEFFDAIDNTEPLDHSESTERSDIRHTPLSPRWYRARLSQRRGSRRPSRRILAGANVEQCSELGALRSVTPMIDLDGAWAEGLRVFGHDTRGRRLSLMEPDEGMARVTHESGSQTSGVHLSTLPGCLGTHRAAIGSPPPDWRFAFRS